MSQLIQKIIELATERQSVRAAILTGSRCAPDAKVDKLFQDTTYVAKYLWRDDLVAAKHILDHNIKLLYLHTMFVWSYEVDRNWSIKPGNYGRGLKKCISPELWARLEETYVGAGLQENRDALFRSIRLFRDVAVAVAKQLGYVYPEELDRRCIEYLEKVRRLDRRAEDVVAILDRTPSKHRASYSASCPL
jgi:Streptomycin adenylyltransferase